MAAGADVARQKRSKGHVGSQKKHEEDVEYEGKRVQQRCEQVCRSMTNVMMHKHPGQVWFTHKEVLMRSEAKVSLPFLTEAKIATFWKMAVKDGTPGDDKWMLAFRDEEDLCSRIVSRRALKMTTKARAAGTNQSLRVNFGVLEAAVGSCLLMAGDVLGVPRMNGGEWKQ